MRSIICYIALLFCAQVSLAKGIDSFVISSKLYTVNDGLAANFVQDILQDSTGFIWAATDNGLSRYDGLHFISFNNENEPLFFKDNRVYGLRLFNNKLYLISKSNGVLELDLKTYVFKLITAKGASDIVFLGKQSFVVLFMDGELRANNKGRNTSIRLSHLYEAGSLALMHQHLIVLAPKVGIFKYILPSLTLVAQHEGMNPSGYHNKFWKHAVNEFLYTNNINVWSVDTNLRVSRYDALPIMKKAISDFVEVADKNYGILVKQFNTPYIYSIGDSSSLKPLAKQQNQGVRVLLKARYQDVFFGATSFGLIKYVVNYPGQVIDQTFSPVTLSYYEKERLLEQKRFLVKPVNESIQFESKHENIKLYFTCFNYALAEGEMGYKFRLNGVDISQGFNPYVNINSLAHGNHALEVVSNLKFANQEVVAFYKIVSVLPFTQTKPFWLMLIIFWIGAGFIILYSITNSLKKEFKIKEAISMDLHDELGTVLTRTYMKVNLMQDMGNIQLSPLVAELNTSLHTLRTYIALLPQRSIKMSMLVANVKDVLSRFMDMHDMVFSFNFEFNKDISVNNKCYRDVLFCLNEICQSILPGQALSGCEIKMNVIQNILEFELIFIKENDTSSLCINQKLLDRLKGRFVLTHRGKIIYKQLSPSNEKITLLFNYKT